MAQVRSCNLLGILSDGTRLHPPLVGGGKARRRTEGNGSRPKRRPTQSCCVDSVRIILVSLSRWYSVSSATEIVALLRPEVVLPYWVLDYTGDPQFHRLMASGSGGGGSPEVSEVPGWPQGSRKIISRARWCVFTAIFIDLTASHMGHGTTGSWYDTVPSKD